MIEPSGEDFDRVYSLLQCPAVGVPEEVGDHLLVAMVGREPLSGISGSEGGSKKIRRVFKHGREGFESRVIPESARAAHRDRGISHWELADLGNERSELLKSLVDYVVQSGKIERIPRMGLVRDVPDEQDPDNRSARRSSGPCWSTGR